MKHIKRRIKGLERFARTHKDLKEIVEILKEYIVDEVEEHQEQFFMIISDKGYGSTKAIFVYYKLREDGKYNFKSMTMRGKFRLAATLVITRESKSNFFGSKSRDVIRYLPRRGITRQDVQALLEIIVPQLNKVMEGFLPGDDSED